jgi:hypothetical protein
MAVTITKPEINLREKLKELDFETVPFQKMPSGSVIQVVSESITSTTVVTANLTPVSVGLIASITPMSSNSKIFVTHNAGGLAKGENRSIAIGCKRNGSFVYGSERLAYTNSADPSEHYPVNYSFSFLDDPSTTSELTYEVFVEKETGSDSIRYLDNDSAMTTPRIKSATITLMEIAG